jgi:hypothetical protein
MTCWWIWRERNSGWRTWNGYRRTLPSSSGNDAAAVDSRSELFYGHVPRLPDWEDHPVSPGLQFVSVPRTTGAAAAEDSTAVTAGAAHGLSALDRTRTPAGAELALSEAIPGTSTKTATAPGTAPSAVMPSFTYGNATPLVGNWTAPPPAPNPYFTSSPAPPPNSTTSSPQLAPLTKKPS